MTDQASTTSIRKFTRHSTLHGAFLHSAHVTGVSVVALNSMAVRVSWISVNLTVVHNYTVHYSAVCVTVNVSFPVSASSGVVSGLQEGQQYQFSVTITFNMNGVVYTGRELS